MQYLDRSGYVKGSGVQYPESLTTGEQKPIVPRRLSSLKALSNAAGVTIVTGPLGAHFWRVLPSTVAIRIEPDGYYDEGPRYATNRLKWALIGLGVPSASATQLCKKAPSAKNKHYRAYCRAVKLVAALESAPVDVSVVSGVEAVPIVSAREARDYLDQADRFAWDTETSLTGQLVGISLCVPGQKPVYVMEEARNLAVTLPELMAQRPSAAHNLKHDLKVLAQTLDRDPRDLYSPLMQDTMVMAWLVQDHVREKHRSLGLKQLTEHYFGEKPMEFGDVCPDGDFAQVDPALQAIYSGADAFNTMRLWPIFSVKLARDSMTPVWTDIEQPLIPVLAGMELRGFPVDLEWFARTKASLEAGLDALVAGLPFKPTRLGAVDYFYKQKGYPVLRETATGQPSVDEEALRAFNDPVANLYLVYTGRVKLLGTYINPVLERGKGTVHARFNQCARDDFADTAAPATGRLSSSDPNLQNQPLFVREGYIPPPGMLVYAADYSQIELRLMAYVSKDAGMLQAFAEGRDIHADLAIRMFPGYTLETLPDAVRRKVKTGQFLMQYGGGAPLLAEKMSIGLEEAKVLHRQLNAARPGVARWKEACLAEARHLGYATTLFGRKRWLPDLQSGWDQKRMQAERQAVNAPIQGSSADIIKIRMPVIDNWHRSHVGEMANQVHDEVDGFVDTPQQAKEIAEIMRYMLGDFAIEAEAGTGPNWLKAK